MSKTKKNPRNVHNWRPFENSETCSHESEFAISRLVFFFFREIFSKTFSACGGPKSLGRTGGTSKPPKKIALQKNMYNQWKNYVFKSDKKMCTSGRILGEKIKKKNEKKKNNRQNRHQVNTTFSPSYSWIKWTCNLTPPPKKKGPFFLGGGYVFLS